MPLNPQFVARNVSGLPDLMRWANDLSGGIFFPFILAALWFLAFIITSSIYGSIKAFSFSSVFLLSLTTAFVALTWVPDWYITFPIIMVGVAGILMWIRGNS